MRNPGGKRTARSLAPVSAKEGGIEGFLKIFR
jgi:hypothetical protein